MPEVTEKSQESENKATEASDKFIQSNEKGLGHAVGTLFRTASTELLTFLGGAVAIPVGIAIATGGAFVTGASALLGHPEGAIIGVPVVAVGVGLGAIGLWAAKLGYSLGWEGAKHTENSKNIYRAGKIAEFAAIPGSIVVPGLYEAAKIFSIAATAISNWMRPAGT